MESRSLQGRVGPLGPRSEPVRGQWTSQGLDPQACWYAPPKWPAPQGNDKIQDGRSANCKIGVTITCQVGAALRGTAGLHLPKAPCSRAWPQSLLGCAKGKLPEVRDGLKRQSGCNCKLHGKIMASKAQRGCAQWNLHAVGIKGTAWLRPTKLLSCRTWPQHRSGSAYQKVRAVKHSIKGTAGLRQVEAP